MMNRPSRGEIHLMRALLALLLLFSGLANAATLPEFPPNAIWSRDISSSTVYPTHPNSTTMITQTGGWGNGNKFQIDQSMHVVHVSAANEATVPMLLVGSDPSGYTDPDCEPLGTLRFPMPAGGAIEGSTDYNCDTANNDCHLYVVLDGSKKLYESYLSNCSITNSNCIGGQLQSGCVIIWDLNKVYPPYQRGDQCTSADAAGFPMASLLFNADEVYAASQVTNGDIGHAIRFILPNASMAAGVYVHPASHAGGPSGSASKIPYGSRLRLKSTFDINTFSSNVAARIILRTMAKYGIVLADGGNIALTAEDDMFTTHKWLEFGFDENNVYLEQMLVGVPLSAFEVIQTGNQIPLTYDCNINGNVLTPPDFIFIDGFDY
jgi:serine/threonine-protein kinase